MKILVCLKQVPDTSDGTLNADFTLQRDRMAQITNPADESALELGLMLRDQLGGRVTVVTMGPERTASMLRDALTRGADDALLLNDPAFAGADTLATARTLVAAVPLLGSFDLILCGRRASDGETGQVGPMMASLLNLPCVVNALAVRAQPSDSSTRLCLQIDQLTEEGTRIWQCQTPAVLTLCEWRYRLRLPSLAGLRSGGKATIRVATHVDIGLSKTQCGLLGSPTRVIRVWPQSGCIRSCQTVSVETFLEKGVLP